MKASTEQILLAARNPMRRATAIGATTDFLFDLALAFATYHEANAPSAAKALKVGVFRSVDEAVASLKLSRQFSIDVAQA